MAKSRQRGRKGAKTSTRRTSTRKSQPQAASKPQAVNSQLIGDLAEDAFKNLCTEARIIANQPTRDRKGWDLVLECPFPAETRSSDWVARPTQITCFAQVKGTITDDGTVPIALAHLERMAKERIPWFVPVLILDPAHPHRPSDAYLVHIGEQLIARIMKRLFEESLAGVPLGDQTMSLPWTAEDRIELNGDAVLATIRKHVPDADAYPDQKQRWRAAARAELERVSGTLSFYYRTDDAIYDALSRLAIGELDFIPLRAFSAKGAILKKTSRSGVIKRGRATMEIEPFSNGESIIELRGAAGTSKLSCSTRAAVTAFPSLPAEYNRLRFDTRFLKFVVTPDGDRQMAWNVKLVNLEAQATLAEIDAAAHALAILSGENAVVTLTTPWGKHPPYSANDRLLHDTRSRWFLTTATTVCAIAQIFGMSLDSVEVDVAKLLTQWRRLLHLRAALDESFRPDSFGIWLPEAPTATEASIVICPGVDLGATVLVGCSALHGPITVVPEDGGFRISIANPQLRRFGHALYGSDQWDEGTVRRLMDDAAAQLEKDGTPLIVTADPPVSVRPPTIEPVDA